MIEGMYVNNRVYCYFLFYQFALLILVSHAEDPKKKDVKDEILPPCQACKILVKSFENGMLSTNKKHFGGGDTAWEEKNLGDYENSETRLVEVQELLCTDVDRGQRQCFKLGEEWEALMEEWWFKHKKTEPDLTKWLCVDKMEMCCSESHYGPECRPCPGHPDSVCNSNGKCKGAGTRKGSGECVCNQGYTGTQCDMCSVNYYESYKDEKKLLCSKCHQACAGACTGPGSKYCKECRPGWLENKEGGCLDADECLTQKPCKKNEFCINNEGSYSCLLCDPSCASCFGDGPDMCKKCAEGFTKQNGLCSLDKGWNERVADWTRYITYFGLCVATCIIFQKNTLIASIIGLAVAVYVSVSEYMIHSVLSPNQPENVIIK